MPPLYPGQKINSLDGNNFRFFLNRMKVLFIFMLTGLINWISYRKLLNRVCIMRQRTYYTVAGAAECAGVTRKTLYSWIKEGVIATHGDREGTRIYLPARTYDGRTEVNENDLDVFMDGLGYEDVEGEGENEEKDTE